MSIGFTEDQVGSYAIDVFVFVDAEGEPISTSTVTPFFVERDAWQTSLDLSLDSERTMVQ